MTSANKRVTLRVSIRSGADSRGSKGAVTRTSRMTDKSQEGTAIGRIGLSHLMPRIKAETIRCLPRGTSSSSLRAAMARRRASLSRVRDREPPWRFMWDTTAILSVLTIIWCSPRTGRKCIKVRKTALSSRQFMCQERNSPVHSPTRRSAFEDRALARHWCVHRDHMATVNRTHSDPPLEKSRVPPL